MSEMGRVIMLLTFLSDPTVVTFAAVATASAAVFILYVTASCALILIRKAMKK